jgi:anti-anti-sigma factor
VEAEPEIDHINASAALSGAGQWRQQRNVICCYPLIERGKMGIKVDDFDSGNGVRLVISGALDAASVERAISACRRLRDRSWDRLEVELVGSDQLDVEGLELLLMLQERVREKRSALKLVACDPEVKRKLDIAGFRRHFVISETAGASAH